MNTDKHRQTQFLLDAARYRVRFYSGQSSVFICVYLWLTPRRNYVRIT